MGFFERLFGSRASSRTPGPTASPTQPQSRTVSAMRQTNRDLLLAIQHSDAGAAAEQLKQGANANALVQVNETYWCTPLTFYFNHRIEDHANYPAIVELLLEHGADPNKVDMDDMDSSGGCTPLVYALNKFNGRLPGTREIVELLIKHGADVNAPSGSGATPLCCAAELGALELVDTLLAAGANPNLPGALGWTPLHSALSAQGDDTSVAASLIAAGADVSFVNKTRDRSILIIAAKMGKVNFVNLLIDEGVDIGWKADGMLTALYQSVLDQQDAVAETLLEHGALRYEPFPSNLLVASAKSSQLSDMLMRYGVRPEEGRSLDDCKEDRHMIDALQEVVQELAGTNEDTEDMTPLFAASYNGDVSTVKSLLEAGANPNSKSFVNFDLNRMFDPGLPKEVGVTIFALARRKRSEPDLFMRMELGIPNLYYPCFFGHYEIVELLLGAGANPNSIMFNGLFPLYPAAEMGHLRIVQALIDSGADVDLRTPRGMTAMRNAAEEGHYDVVRLLLEHGAEANQCSVDGSTALGAAVHFGHQDIASLLRQHGAAR